MTGCSWSDCDMPCWRFSFILEGNLFQRPKTQNFASANLSAVRSNLQMSWCSFPNWVTGFYSLSLNHSSHCSEGEMWEMPQSAGRPALHTLCCLTFMLWAYLEWMCARIGGILGVYWEGWSVIPFENAWARVSSAVHENLLCMKTESATFFLQGNDLWREEHYHQPQQVWLHPHEPVFQSSDRS